MLTHPLWKSEYYQVLTPEQVDYIIDQASCVRDKAIISLFADTGLRLGELSSIDPKNMDWEQRLAKVRCKGNKEGLAVFGEHTKSLLQDWLTQYTPNGTLCDIHYYGMQIMTRRLAKKSGMQFTCHTFRRTFASILAKRNIDSSHILRLGRWESIQMADGYTRSVKFEDRLKLYSAIVN